MRVSLGGVACAATAAVMSFVLAPAASAVTFTTPVQLVGTNSSGKPDPTAGPFGGEPSIAADSLGHVYVSSPEGIPSGLGGHGGQGFWISGDGGNTFSSGKYIGSYLGGGDSDVIIANTPKANSVFTADLEAAATEVCLSTDFGKTFTGTGPFPDPSSCTTINGGQTAPSDDRPWLTYDPGGKHLYVTYHEFVSAQPLAFRSDNGGADGFANPCGPIVTDPSIEANVPTDITGGTLVARPVVDSHGNLYVLFATTTQQENANAAAAGQPSGTFSQLYLAVSKDNCQSFTDYTVFNGESKYGENTVQFGDIFNNLAIDGAGNLYVVGAGFVNTPSNTATTWMLRSGDGGQHWTQPTQLGGANAKSSAYMLPAAVGGPQAGQLTVGYFRTINGATDPNNTTAQWTYSSAQSTDANAASPTFTYTDVNAGHVYHTGEICNLGILCGAVPGAPSDRSLLDFTSVALDPSGCPLFTFGGNTPASEANGQTWNYVTRQTSGCFAAAPSTPGISPSGGGVQGGGGGQQGGGSQGGGQSHHPKRTAALRRRPAGRHHAHKRIKKHTRKKARARHP
jgi:hypothetical protein